MLLMLFFLCLVFRRRITMLSRCGPSFRYPRILTHCGFRLDCLRSGLRCHHWLIHGLIAKRHWLRLWLSGGHGRTPIRRHCHHWPRCRLGDWVRSQIYSLWVFHKCRRRRWLHRLNVFSPERNRLLMYRLPAG